MPERKERFTPLDSSLIALSGLDEEKVLSQWDRWGSVRSASGETGLVPSLGQMLGALVSLERDLKDGILPADTEKAREAVSYVRMFLSEWGKTPVSSFAPMPFSRSDTEKIPIGSLFSGKIRTEIRVEEIIEYGEEKYGELREVLPKEVSNGIMTVGEWKFENGSLWAELLDGEGNAAVYEEEKKK